MTSERRYLAARSIAALDDPASIETRPLSKIRADLAKLGVDASVSIERARSYAGKRSMPADRLLARLDGAEAIDAEIEALKKADIDDVRGIVPGGAAASMAADAKRRAGIPSNVTKLHRSHRRVLGWGGSMIGLAACLLLYVVTRPDQIYQADLPVFEEADDVADIAEAATTESASKVRNWAPLEEADRADREVTLIEPGQRAAPSKALQSSEAAKVLENLTSRAATRQRDPQQNVIAEPQATARLSEREAEPLEKKVPGAAPAPEAFLSPKAKPATPAATLEESVVALAPKASHIPTARPASPIAELNEAVAAPKAEAAQALAGARTRGRIVPNNLASAVIAEDAGSPQKEFGQLDLGAAEMDVAGITDSDDEWDSPQAVLIIDPDKAPLALKVQAEILPKGDLADRLDDARRLAGDGDVVALMTVLRDGREVDAALSFQPRSSLADIDAIAGFSAAPQVYDDGGFEFIELPGKP